MLSKEWVQSASLSQSPLMVLPNNYLSRLDGVRLQAHERKQLSSRECEEYLVCESLLSGLRGGTKLYPVDSVVFYHDLVLHKTGPMQRYQRTAKVVEAEPWCLIKAAGYLRTFVETQP